MFYHTIALPSSPIGPDRPIFYTTIALQSPPIALERPIFYSKIAPIALGQEDFLMRAIGQLYGPIALSPTCIPLGP